jgi:tetratricopeptide (TPR) repeat protein
MIRTALLTISLTIILGSIIAQDEYPYPSLSPQGRIFQKVGNTSIQIDYERPSARKRKIFGALVPWNRVWRTGAGKCTKIIVDQPIKIGGQQLEKGAYSFFTIPNPHEWIVILNKDTSLYGSYDYNPENDVARFVVIPQTTHRYYETLNFDIELIPNNARIYLSWENTQLSFEVETTTDESIEILIEKELLTGKERNSDIYAGAAEYYLYQGVNLFEAIALANKALEMDKNNAWARDLKVRIYKRLKLYDKALLEMEKALDEVKAAEYENEKDRRRELESLNDRIRAIEMEKNE